MGGKAKYFAVAAALVLAFASAAIDAQSRGGGGREWHGGGRGPSDGYRGRFDGRHDGHYYRYRGPRVGVYFGAPYAWGSPYYWGPAWSLAWPWYGYVYPYPYPYAPPVVEYSVPGPTEYVERAPGPASERGLWYYCTDPAGYYPHVARCNVPWVEVQPSDAPRAPGR